jgi:hypothetical protein
MAFLELLARTAGAKIVAADLFSSSPPCRSFGISVGTSHASVFEFPLLFALKLMLEFIDRRRRSFDRHGDRRRRGGGRRGR